MSSTPDTSVQSGKTLQLFLSKLNEAEKQEDELKNKLIAAENEIKSTEVLLSKVTDQVKTIDDKIIDMCSRLPKAVSKTVVIESENKIICQQVQTFESKIEQIKRQISETEDKHNREIDQFVEQSFSFAKNYGFNGRIRCQTQVLQKTVDKLKAKRNELKDQIQSLNTSDSNSVLAESKCLSEQINELNQKKALLTNENYELKCIQTNLKTRLNETQIKTKTAKEIKELEKQLDDLKNKSNQKKFKTIEPIVLLNDPKCFESATELLKKKQKLSVHFKEPKIIEISDGSEDSSPKKSTSGQCGQQSEPPKDKSTYFMEKKKQIQNELKTKTSQQLWELKRKRRQLFKQ